MILTSMKPLTEADRFVTLAKKAEIIEFYLSNPDLPISTIAAIFVVSHKMVTTVSDAYFRRPHPLEEKEILVLTSNV